MLAVCPQCEKALVVDDSGWHTCRHCGRRVWIPDPVNPDRPPADDSGAAAPEPAASAAPDLPPPVDIPWETGRGGPVSRLLATVPLFLFRSRQVYGRFPDRTDNSRSLIYGLLVAATGLVIHFQLQAMSYDYLMRSLAQPDAPAEIPAWLQGTIQEMQRVHLDSTFFQTSSLLAPLLAAAIILGGHRLLSMGLYLARGRTALPPPRAFRLLAYSYTPFLFIAVPFLGPIWFMVVQYHALQSGLGLSRWSAMLLVALNFLFFNFVLSFWNFIYTLIVG